MRTHQFIRLKTWSTASSVLFINMAIFKPINNVVGSILVTIFVELKVQRVEFSDI